MIKLRLFAGALFLIFYISGQISVAQTRIQGLAYSQGDGKYEKDWKIVDSLLQQGLPESALLVVDKIYASAKAEKDHPQFLKALLNRISLISSYQEDFYPGIIKDLEDETNSFGGPANQIIHSVLGDLYWRFYETNRFRILDRTQTESFDPNDIKTWDITRITDQSIRHFMHSLKSTDELKGVSLKQFDLILETTTGSKKYRPTLYDFLAHRAIDFFFNKEASITRPAETFEIFGPLYFSNARDFTNLKIVTPDSMALPYYGILILQDVIRFHLEDEDPVPLIDADIKRMGLIRQHNLHEKRDSLYLMALYGLEKQYKNQAVSADIRYSIARELKEQGNRYHPFTNPGSKWFLREAEYICKGVINEFPESEGATNCKVILAEIQSKELEFTTDRVVIPSKPFPVLIKFRNINVFYVKAVPVDPEINRAKTENYLSDEEILTYYNSLPVYADWKIETDTVSDRQGHSLEVISQALPSGYYALIISDHPDYKLKNSVVSYNLVWVSGISYIYKKDDNLGISMIVLDRESGKQLSNVKVNTYSKHYDYSSRSYKVQINESFITDKAGFILLPQGSALSKTASFFIEFVNGSERLFSDEYFYISPVQTKEEYRNETVFFTDRAIYRPGQTVYFKGIMLGREGERNEIKPGLKTVTGFYDVNNQKISELRNTTNEFGSFSGSFVIPVGLLNGNMSIRNESGSISFRVEEYKRPTFEVVFDQVEDVYKLGQEVTLKGKAKGFSGNDIGNASVMYRVVRNYYLPYGKYFYGWDFFPRHGRETEILSGQTMTQANGEFAVNFSLLPDKSVQPSFEPVFNYTVFAEVTDISGEVQSSSSWISAGYKGLILDIDIPENVDVSKEQKFVVRAQNLNGKKQNTEVRISIYKLIEPAGIPYERKWESPEKLFTGNDETGKIFENFYMSDPKPWLKWENGNKAYEGFANLEKDSMITLVNLKSWRRGYYRVEAMAKDPFGEEVIWTGHFLLFSKDDKKLPAKLAAWFNVVNESSEPGGLVSFMLGSSAKNINVLYEITHRNKTVSRSWVSLSDEVKLINIPVSEDMRGGFSVNLAFVAYNRSYDFSASFKVPEVSREIDFEFITFRNLIEPGSKEEWSIRLRDKKGDKLAAELLAGMYDASLDQFAKSFWNLYLQKPHYTSRTWQCRNSFLTRDSRNYQEKDRIRITPFYQDYDGLNWFGFSYYDSRYMAFDGVTLSMDDKQKMLPPGQVEMNQIVDETSVPDDRNEPGDSPVVPRVTKSEDRMQIRRDFRETAFFFPDLFTNPEGDVIISFTAPESFTRYRFLGLAHTRDLFTGSFDKEVTARKDLMVIPNMPRFVREGDRIRLQVKAVNLSSGKISGNINIEFTDPITGSPIVGLINENDRVQSLDFKEGESVSIGWEILVPQGSRAISVKVMAGTETHSDGFEVLLPVLSNRMLVTESLPLPLNANQSRTFRFGKLLSSGQSGSLRSHKLTVEFTSNPVWYAVQALPSLIENENENLDDVFNRYFANSLSMLILDKNPAIQNVFDIWRKYEPSALLSNLEKNQELKNIVLQETPWVMDSKEEKDAKYRMSLLFDRVQINAQLDQCIRKLKDQQTQGGGWAWFKGMPESRWVTQYIVTGFSRLISSGALDLKRDNEVKNMLNNALRYLDGEIMNSYNKIKERYPDKLSEDHLGYLDIQYIYSRSLFQPGFPVSKNASEAFDYYTEQMKKYWVKRNKYMQGMIALGLHYQGEKEIPARIIASLKETAITDEENGMYWRDNSGGYFWYEAPVETQALLIEVFSTLAHDNNKVELMKKWLLKQKQTQSWSSGKSTAEAVFALMMYGNDWLAETESVQLKIGDFKIIPSDNPDLKTETATGYFKTTWLGDDIQPGMGEISVQNPKTSPAWGALYWQYFEDLNKISSQATGLKISKKLMISRNTPSGPILEDISPDKIINPGDNLVSRIIISTDRDMEFVHLKDMRAAAFEPVAVTSGYHYQDGLGYYQSARDASTDFFFEYLPKGTYVFEYQVRVTQQGDFSNGTAMIQCMYAPEFNSHSEGFRVRCGQ